MATTPSVSVVLAAHNGARFVAEAIESILRQTYPFLELIVIDDGSTDETPEIVTRIRDPRIKLVRQPNLWISLTRNRGVAMARGILRGIGERVTPSLAYPLPLVSPPRWSPATLRGIWRWHRDSVPMRSNRRRHFAPCHSRESGNPGAVLPVEQWIPAFAGMTIGRTLSAACGPQPKKAFVPRPTFVAE